MKTLSSVLFVLAATAVPAFADSAYFLPAVTSSSRPAVVATSNRSAVRSTDRVSVNYRPMTRTAVAAAKMPMVFVDRRYTRGTAQAAVVR